MIVLIAAPKKRQRRAARRCARRGHGLLISLELDGRVSRLLVGINENVACASGGRLTFGVKPAHCLTQQRAERHLCGLQRMHGQVSRLFPAALPDSRRGPKAASDLLGPITLQNPHTPDGQSPAWAFLPPVSSCAHCHVKIRRDDRRETARRALCRRRGKGPRLAASLIAGFLLAAQPPSAEPAAHRHF